MQAHLLLKQAGSTVLKLWLLCVNHPLGWAHQKRLSLNPWLLKFTSMCAKKLKNTQIEVDNLTISSIFPRW